MLKSTPIFIRLLFLLLVVNMIVILAYGSFSQVKSGAISDLASGKKLFKNNCAGCHVNGENLIKADKPIIGSLKTKSQFTFSAFLDNPPPPMPKFKNITNKPEQLNDLYNYVVSLMGK